MKASAPGSEGGCPLESSVPEVTRRQGDEELSALNLTTREGDTQSRSASYRTLRGSGGEGLERAQVWERSFQGEL